MSTSFVTNLSPGKYNYLSYHGTFSRIPAIQLADGQNPDLTFRVERTWRIETVFSHRLVIKYEVTRSGIRPTSEAVTTGSVTITLDGRPVTSVGVTYVDDGDKK